MTSLFLFSRFPPLLLLLSHLHNNSSFTRVSSSTHIPLLFSTSTTSCPQSFLFCLLLIDNSRFAHQTLARASKNLSLARYTPNTNPSHSIIPNMRSSIFLAIPFAVAVIAQVRRRPLLLSSLQENHTIRVTVYISGPTTNRQCHPAVLHATAQKLILVLNSLLLLP